MSVARAITSDFAEGELPLTIEINSSMSAEETVFFIRQQFDSLQVSTKAVIVAPIDSLPGKSPLALQAICDDGNAPKKGLMIVMPIARQNETNIDCDYVVERHLEEKWMQQDLNKDKVAAILSRVTAHTVCL